MSNNIHHAAFITIVALATAIVAAGARGNTSESESPTTGDSSGSTQQVLTSDNTPTPFGANLFSGNFAKTRQTGLNPDYVVVRGDQVAVYTWGAIQIDGVFTVDSQGNIFLPEIGPVHLEGTANRNLTQVVESAIKRVYARHFGVYTNLLTPNPVAVYVTGGVSNPGRYAGLPSDSILFYLDQAGGIDSDMGSYRHIVLIRDKEEIARVDLYDFLTRGQLELPQLKDNDTILVMRRGNVIDLSGGVVRPTRLELASDFATGQDALALVPLAATSTAVTLKGIRDGKPVSKTLSLAAFGQQPLKNGDKLIFRDDGRSDTILVRLEGEFDGPSELAVQRGARLLDVLNHVPVNPTMAHTNAVHVKRTTVAKAQKDAIHDALFRLERSALLALSSSRGEADIRVKEAELTAKFVERARQIQPLGRVVTAQHQKQLNVMLEDGDTIVIPQKTNIVRIGGEVMVSQAVVHNSNLRAKDYVFMAGGYSERADDDKVIILHADASVSVESPNTPVRPGDEILIPPRIDVKVMQNATDIMQIIYQVAMSAGVVLAL